MKTILTAIGLMLTLSLVAANGQIKRKPGKTMAAVKEGCTSTSPWEQTQTDWDVGQNLPANLKKDELIKLLHPAPLRADNPGAGGIYLPGEVLVGVGAKTWKYLPGAQIVVVETKRYVSNTYGGVDEKDRTLSVAVVKQSPDSAALTVIAKTAAPLTFEKDFHFNKFDLASYKLDETNYAFGLRRCVVDQGTGYINAYEALDLFRLAGENVEKIFSAAVGYGHFGIRDERDDYSRAATVSVTPQKTNGYFNLIKTFGAAKPAVFKWDGKSYQMTSKDPFSKFADPDNIP